MVRISPLQYWNTGINAGRTNDYKGNAILKMIAAGPARAAYTYAKVRIYLRATGYTIADFFWKVYS